MMNLSIIPVVFTMTTTTWSRIIDNRCHDRRSNEGFENNHTTIFLPSVVFEKNVVKVTDMMTLKSGDRYDYDWLDLAHLQYMI